MKRSKSLVGLGAAFLLATGGLGVVPAQAADAFPVTEWVGDDGGLAGRELPSVGAKGEYVVFVGRSADYAGVYVKDRLQPTLPAKRVFSGYAFNPDISADGKVVTWSVLSSSDRGIYVLEWTKSGAVPELVSLGDDGQPARAVVDYPSISGNGRYVAFQAMTSNLDDDVAPGKEGGGPNKVYVRDRLLDETEMVSVADAATGLDQVINGNGIKPDITPDGKFVAFASDASALQGVEEGETTTTYQQVYLRDRTAKTTLTVSAVPGATAGEIVLGNAISSPTYGPSVSADGHLVAFESDATNFVADDPEVDTDGDTNGDTDAFVRNMTTGAMTRVSVMEDAGEADILADGTTEAPAAEPTVTVMEGPGSGSGGSGGSGGDATPDATPNVGLGPVLSADGTFVVFESKAALTADDENGGQATCEQTVNGVTTTVEGFVEPADIYRYALADGTLTRVSKAGLVEGAFEASGYRVDGHSGLCVPVNNGVDPATSADGSEIAFVSNGNLVGRTVEAEEGEEPSSTSLEPSVYVRAFDAATADGGSYDGGTTPSTPPGGGGTLPPPVVPDPGDVEADETAPVSRATSPKYDAGDGFRVRYTAADEADGSGVAKVELFAKAVGAPSYSKVATDSGDGIDGFFSYVPAAGEGAYAFYTVATDEAGNVEAAPSTADCTTVVDTTMALLQRRMGKGPFVYDRGDQQRMQFRFRVSERVRATFLIRHGGQTVKTIGPRLVGRGLFTQSWFGRDDAKRPVDDGRYVLAVRVRDGAGNLTVLRTRFRVTR